MAKAKVMPTQTKPDDPSFASQFYVPDEPPTAILIRQTEVLRQTALSTSHLYALISESKFPRPVKVGRAAVAWDQAEVQAWIVDRKKARGAAYAAADWITSEADRGPQSRQHPAVLAVGANAGAEGAS